MSIVTDIFLWLLIETALGFLFYTTGCMLLKVTTFGSYKMEFKDYASFKQRKSKKVVPVIALGVGFYITMITLLAFINS